ncbi:unnamed protein product [Protopolystoma xenopodis]|uniref:Uncharacterized protein n=1 Tax=Protopolystoma xenopodis TaxID=117903 RepID=A0A448XHW7_9PLAT|nr:unnamed protein product [Protopolystoma xenopodis]
MLSQEIHRNLSEQQRLLLERRVFELEKQLKKTSSHSGCSAAVAAQISATMEVEVSQDSFQRLSAELIHQKAALNEAEAKLAEQKKRLDEANKSALSAREQAESARKAIALEESRSHNLQGKLTQALNGLTAEQKRLNGTQDTLQRLTRELESAKKQAQVSIHKTTFIYNFLMLNLATHSS